MQAVLNVSVQQQRARILVPAIVQGLTRRPAASDAGVLHVQGAPAFALSIPQADIASSQRHGTLHRAAQLCSAARGRATCWQQRQPEPQSRLVSKAKAAATCALQPMSPDGHRPH